MPLNPKKSLKCFTKMAKSELVDARPSNSQKYRLKIAKLDGSCLQVPDTTVRACSNITRDHHARIVSSNRECFAHYRQIFHFFNRSSLSLYVYTRGIWDKTLRGNNLRKPKCVSWQWLENSHDLHLNGFRQILILIRFLVPVLGCRNCRTMFKQVVVISLFVTAASCMHFVSVSI